MPGFDKTGPNGEGAMTGGGFGRCGGARRGRGGGRGRGQGAGQGWGWKGGDGRRARRRRRRTSQRIADSRLEALAEEALPEANADTLRREAEILEAELAAIKERLAALES